MCGIAGWVDFNQELRDKEKIVQEMADTLVRRGPDAGGIYMSKNACLAHRRLIVIDPENGKQPMSYAGDRGNYTLVYNGELYNTDEVRDELKKYGYKFNGHSDTEVLLMAFVQWGESCVDKLNGIYAFGIWDEKKERLFLARDRMGVKPLFYFNYEGGIIFGSEIKTLLKNPIVKPVIDNNGLNEVFMLGPGRTIGEGIIKGIKEVKPGEFLVLNKDGMNIKTYWSVKAKEHTENLSTTIEHTRHLIIDAIKGQLVSDVPLCCFLSGGLDSSIIANIAAGYYKENNKGQLTTYSVDYTDNEKYFTKSVFQPDSDMEYINIMKNQIGSNHRRVVLNNTDLFNALEEATEARDLPGMADIDSSLLLFCREVKKDFTVSVSGECADEIFGGYPWYHNKDILFENTFPWSRSLDVRKKVVKDGILKDSDEYVYQRYQNTVNSTDKLSTDSKLDARMREMFMLNINWFMQTLLDRKDRMTMYNGLEVRVPFCDHRLVEYAYNMPWEMKSLDGREKGLVREAMRGILPDKVLWRKKSPYPKTHNPIYMNLVTERVEQILNDKNSIVSELINRKTIEEIKANPYGLTTPWYGQLMAAPQIFAYIIQMDYWFRKYNINVIDN
ncbi:MAG: asparagine synthase (glutamine-hydrolyzing) [Clostridium sp.]|uniref:asparagine synthase (glutamine-hydrolyzing) n=1 Tax=Clostridium sp. TaxID=1506 RepID=UPI003024BCC6